MYANVIKRDGRVCNFYIGKIENAIRSAMLDVDHIDEQFVKSVTAEIAEKYRNIPEVTVEQIQDDIEKKLMCSRYKDAAKAFILYRNNRTVQRKCRDGVYKEVVAKTNATNVENANANVDERSFGGRKNEAANIIQKEIALDFIMDPAVAAAHRDGYIYQHDLDSYAVGMHNCLFADVGKLLKNGFKTRNGDVRPANSFSTACQFVAVIFQCQSQVQFGGVASAHLDYDLAPYVKKSFYKHYADGMRYIAHLDVDWHMYENDNLSIDDDVFKGIGNVYQYAMDMLEREGRQSSQGLVHNLNTLESRAGSQVPFSSNNFGRDTSVEGRLVTKWMLEAVLDGIGEHHLTSIFPISIFQYKKGCNAQATDPNYDMKQLAIKSMTHRIYPNFINCDCSNAHEDLDNIDTYFASMGCRTMLGFDRHGLGYTRVGRGNNVPITIILPKLAIEYGICLGERTEPDLDGFMTALDDILNLTGKALLDRYNYLRSQTPKAAPFMYDNGTIQDADKCTDDVRNSLRHNTLAFGYIGIAEMCKALFGENQVHSQSAYDFAMKVVQHMSDFTKKFSEENNVNGSLYATPAENLCHTALMKLRNQYGIIDGVTDHEYLTNSHHVPVYENVSIQEKLNLEAPFCKYATAGCITYIELDSTLMNNPKAIEDIIDYAFGLDIPYLAFNFPIDSCLDCGYQGEFNYECPMCHSKKIQQLRRVTGYITTDYHKFNDGKQAEVEERAKHHKFETLEAHA